MRILLIGNFAPDRQESMLRFAHLMSDGLRDAGHPVETWSPEPALVRCLPRYRYGGAAKFFGYFDKFVLFPRRLRARLQGGRRPDVVHILDHANAVYAPHLAGVPLLATCHDLLQVRAAQGEFPQHRVAPLGRRYQRWILESIARIPQVVCSSQKTRADLERLARLPAARMAVIPNGLNYPYRPLAAPEARLIVGRLLRERHLPPGGLEHGGRGFLLNIGGGQWYKNRRGLLEMYAALRPLLPLPPRLVLVGKPLAPDLALHARQLGLGGDLIHVNRVSEVQLQALYSLAAGLVFPSWEEGFGWPVAEAQACGCPVFTSCRAPMTEVGGDAAEYVDPGDPRGAAERIADAWPRRAGMAARGLARAVTWDPARMIALYLEAYERGGARRVASLAVR